MYSSKDYVREDLELQKQLRRKYMAVMRKLPEGKLTVSVVKGGLYYYSGTGKNRVYVGTGDRKQIKDIQKRRLLEETIKRIDQNMLLMEAFLEKYQSTELETVVKDLPKAYRMASAVQVHSEVFINAKKWEAKTYQKSTRNEADLRHKTQKGDLVRSKSEVIIANILYGRNIPYHYEEIVSINGVTMAPDFKIAVVSENRFKFLEHCGMISDAEYRESFLWKLRNYIEDGYVPWRDVFFTFDDLEGSIDTLTIYKIIDQFLA